VPLDLGVLLDLGVRPALNTPPAPAHRYSQNPDILNKMHKYCANMGYIGNNSSKKTPPATLLLKICG
jgi:hypothetical protein